MGQVTSSDMFIIRTFITEFTEETICHRLTVAFSAHLVDIILSVEGKGKGENIVSLVVWTAVVKHTLVRKALPGEQ